MPSTFTTNLHLELQATGENSGAWGQNLNNNVFSIIDQVLGNTFNLPLTNSDVTLNTAQSQNNFISLTGNLTANVNVIFPNIGRTYFVRNGTSGPFTVTLKTSAAGGAAVAIPQGSAGFYILSGGDVISLWGSVAISGGTINIGSNPLVAGASTLSSLTVTGGNINNALNGVFNGTSTQVILGTLHPSGDSGIVILRPCGYSSSSGQTLIDSGGNMSVAGNITANSDVRLKEDVAPLDPDAAMDAVRRANPVSYTMKETGSKGIGFIAQEMREIVPELVHEGEEYLSLAYGNYVAVLSAALKQIDARLSRLEARR